jgi:hypothetical protein
MKASDTERQRQLKITMRLLAMILALGALVIAAVVDRYG